MRVIDRRAFVACQIEDMRATDDAVHEALLETTGLGVTYDRLAELACVDASRVVMWSAGAGIPSAVADKRRILAACVQALRSPAATVDDRLAARQTTKPKPLLVIVKKPMCVVCMTNVVTDNVRNICGRTNCYRRHEQQRRIAAMHGG